jgi:hypothetical protein
MLDSDFLKKLGIDIGLVISGVFGALLMSGNNTLKSTDFSIKSAISNTISVLSSLIAGAASANYLTPIVVDIFNIKESHYNYGTAFLLGFIGLKGVEAISKRLLSTINTDEKKETTKPNKRHGRSKQNS